MKFLTFHVGGSVWNSFIHHIVVVIFTASSIYFLQFKCKSMANHIQGRLRKIVPGKRNMERWKKEKRGKCGNSTLVWKLSKINKNKREYRFSWREQSLLAQNFKCPRIVKFLTFSHFSSAWNSFVLQCCTDVPIFTATSIDFLLFNYRSITSHRWTTKNRAWEAEYGKRKNEKHDK